MVAETGGSHNRHKKMLAAANGFASLAAMLTSGTEAEWKTRKMRIDARLRLLNPPSALHLLHSALASPSLLARAFRSHLVPQDPTDEPASALLERIQSKHTDY